MDFDISLFYPWTCSFLFLTSINSLRSVLCLHLNPPNPHTQTQQYYHTHILLTSSSSLLKVSAVCAQQMRTPFSVLLANDVISMLSSANGPIMRVEHGKHISLLCLWECNVIEYAATEIALTDKMHEHTTQKYKRRVERLSGAFCFWISGIVPFDFPVKLRSELSPQLLVSNMSILQQLLFNISWKTKIYIYIFIFSGKAGQSTLHSIRFSLISVFPFVYACRQYYC